MTLSPPLPASTRTALQEGARRGITALSQVVVGKEFQVRRAVATLLAGGHLLLEDLPGVGKTTLAKGLCRIMGGSYQRIQGTNDLLPSDLLGVNLWDSELRAFRFQEGPVFTNVLLMDELNRIGPKTQSALLEVMVEGQVTLDRGVYPLPSPFFVIATQNPMDHAGTFPLPESQLDRFSCVLHLGYPDAAAERRILRDEAGADRLRELEPALTLEEWSLARRDIRCIQLSDAVLDYAERVIARIRHDGAFCSTRAVGHWLTLSRAEAWLEGRTYATPDDLQSTLGDSMAHRGALDDRRLNREERRASLGKVLRETPVGWMP
ncbi:AAA family ATPase [Holophaga foetida]|uniref:AAA family ATPase n=1 Tax=Holophaga foetida TaxID=35839 RepID=UPI000247535A|nr:AAA family ATPase [Holophaga foetida]